MSRYYDIDKFKYPSVTTIIGDCTDKSQALMPWVAKCYRLYMEDIILGYESADQSAMPFGVLRSHLDEGKQKYRDISKEALDIGSETHENIEERLKHKMHGHDKIIEQFSCDQAENAFNAFLEWEKEHDLKPISIEKTVYGNGWAGTLDYLGLYNGKLYVIDWKSSKAIYPEMRYQIAAYRWATAKAVYNKSEELWGMEVYSSTTKRKECLDYFKEHVPDGSGILRLDKTTGMPEFKDFSKSYEKDLNVFNKMVDLYFARHPRIAKKAGR